MKKLSLIFILLLIFTPIVGAVSFTFTDNFWGGESVQVLDDISRTRDFDLEEGFEFIPDITENWDMIYLTGTEDMSRDTSIFYTGLGSLKSEINSAASGRYAYLVKSFSLESSVWATSYFRTDSFPTSEGNIILLIAFSYGAYFCEAGLVYNDSQLQWALGTYEDGAYITLRYRTPFPVPQSNTWYRVDLYTRISATEGEYRFYIDGNPIISASGLNSSGQGNIGELRIGVTHSIGQTSIVHTDTIGIDWDVESYSGYLRTRDKTFTEIETPYDSTGLVSGYHLNDYNLTSNDERVNNNPSVITDFSGIGNNGETSWVSQDELELWLAFEDGNASTTVTDLSGEGNTGTWYGKASGDKNVTESIYGLGDAGYFDATNDYVDTAPISLPEAITLEVIFRSPDVGTYRRLVGNWNNTATVGYDSFLRSSGVITFQLGRGGWAIASSTSGAYDDNTWQHLVVTWNQGLLRIYVNGTEALYSPQGSSATYVESTRNVEIGRYHGGQYFNGEIDEVRVYNRSLSSTEIMSHYKQWVIGIADRGLRFDGVDDVVSVSESPEIDFDTSDDYTITAWINPIGTDGYLISKRGATYPIILRLANGQLNYIEWDGSNAISITGTTNLTDGGWYHIASTHSFTESKTEIFVNGVSEGSDSILSGSTTNNNDWKIGARSTTQGQCNVVMDEIRIYNRSLGVTELLEDASLVVINGTAYSTNLLADEYVQIINSFDYNASIVSPDIVRVQFSQDNSSWVDSGGVSVWETLSDGENSIDLRGLDWAGNFYYRTYMERGMFDSPELVEISVLYSDTKYPTYGGGSWLLIIFILAMLAVPTYHFLRR